MTAGALATEVRLATREVRSFEVEHAGGLWHFDYYHGSRKVLTPRRMADVDFARHSRRPLAHRLPPAMVSGEMAENLIHDLIQAFMKRGLPRAIMSDDGAAMIAAETTQGFARLGILHETTLPYSPYQNAKQKAFWGPTEWRLIAMLEGIADLTLTQLNEATQAWTEQDYHSKLHSEIDEAPIAAKPATGLPPLLIKMLDARAVTGLLPAYLVKDEEDDR